MYKSFSVAVICMLALAGCGGEDLVEPCPVSYTIDSINTYTLVGNWKFVGFDNKTTSSLESPLCGDVESFITFTDSLHGVIDNAAYKYPWLLKGGALVNSLSGSYERMDSTGLRISKTVKTTINGTDQVEEFEQRYYSLLESVNRFEISNNELWLYAPDNDVAMKFVADN